MYIIPTIIILTAVFLWLSNSIKNEPPITSPSISQFFVKLTRRHWLVTPVIIMILGFNLIFLRLLGIIMDGFLLC